MDRSASPPPGPLVLVVGPSGAGKDSVLAGARHALAGHPRLRFVTRVITRPADAGGEDHLAVDVAEFTRRRDAGGFLLHWHAHGLDYGIPAVAADWRAAGGTVVANVSRTVVAAARRDSPPVRVAMITAAASVLAARLAVRGRESAVDIQARLQRASQDHALEADFVLHNDADLETAIRHFAAWLLVIADGGQTDRPAAYPIRP